MSEERLRLGGMALRNGLLVHGPTHWAIAVRNPAGELEVASGAKPTLARGRLATIPFLRGPLRLAEALTVVPLARLRLRSARLPLEDPRVLLAAAGATATSPPTTAPNTRRSARTSPAGRRRTSRRSTSAAAPT